MTTVYRLAHGRTKHGPYNADAPPNKKYEKKKRFFDTGGSGWWWAEADHGSLSRTPVPPHEHKCHVDAVFGFRTVEHVARWFSATELARLVAEGFRIIKAQAEEILYDDGQQIVFRPRDKRLLKHIKRELT